MKALNLFIVSLFAFLLTAGTAQASTPFAVSPAHLVANQAVSITVDNTIPSWKIFIVMPGPDFVPVNGSCYTNLRISTGNLPRNVWACKNFSAPIVFNTFSLNANDLVANSNNSLLGFGYVGFVGTGGVSRGVWTLSWLPSKFDYQAASSF